MNDVLTSQKDHAVQLVQQNRLLEARNLYREICAANESDVDAWFRLGAVSGMLGDLEAAVACSRKAIILDPLSAPAYANLGNALQGQGKLMETVQCYWTLAMNMYGAERFKDTQDALNKLLEVPVTPPPEQLAEIYFNLGSCCLVQKEYRDAVGHLRKSASLQPDSPKQYLKLGDALAALNRFEEAGEAYRELLRIAPNNSEAYACTANAFERMHKLDDAADLAQKSLECAPNNPAATVLLAKLDRRKNKLEAARTKLEAARAGLTDVTAYPSLHFELGQVYDRLGRYTEAFESFRLGNEGMSRTATAKACRDDAKQYILYLAGCQESFNAERLAGWRGREVEDALPDPVFLLGHPRSGTTLTEQVLSAHSEVVVSDEQPIMDHIVLAIGKKIGDLGNMPEYLDTVTPEELRSLRTGYWDQAEMLLESGVGGKILVDKFPLNLKYLGLIQRVFPKARILVALRDPRDVCLSCFMQHFQPNKAMVHFFDIEQAARHYAAIMGLWLHYREILDLRWIETRYEDLVVDFEPTARRLISFLDLDWDDGVLTYFEKKRHISTPSYQDVASPIFSRAMGRWRKYRTELQPALSHLAPFVREFGYEE